MLIMGAEVSMAGPRGMCIIEEGIVVEGFADVVFRGFRDIVWRDFSDIVLIGGSFILKVAEWEVSDTDKCGSDMGLREWSKDIGFQIFFDCVV
jgi:hypothetical protein